MGKVFRLGDGRSKTGKILDRDTKWFCKEIDVLRFIEENPSYASKSLYVSDNGKAYVKTSIEECNRALNRINRN